jgi:hypothetical protein
MGYSHAGKWKWIPISHSLQGSSKNHLKTKFKTENHKYTCRKYKEMLQDIEISKYFRAIFQKCREKEKK